MKKIALTIETDRQQTAEIIRHIRYLRRSWKRSMRPDDVLRHASGYAAGCAEEHDETDEEYRIYSHIAYQLEVAAEMRRPLSWTTSQQPAWKI